jgi:hypothetical protein
MTVVRFLCTQPRGREVYNAIAATVDAASMARGAAMG